MSKKQRVNYKYTPRISRYHLDLLVPFPKYSCLSINFSERERVVGVVMGGVVGGVLVVCLLMMVAPRKFMSQG